MSRHARNAALHAAGDFESLVAANLGLAVTIIRQMYPTGLSTVTEDDDLDQIAVCALIKAVRGWTPDRGLLSHYLRFIIQHEVRETHRRGGGRTIPLSREMQTLLTRAASHGLHLPDLAEDDLPAAADLLRVTEAELRHTRDTLRATSTLFGLDAVLDKPSASNVEDEAIQSITNAEIRAIVNTLPDDQRAIVTARYGLDTGTEQTITDIAATVGVSRQAAYNRLAKAENTLRSALTAYRNTAA